MSSAEDIARVGVVGGGIMGGGIAEVAARAGFEVALVEIDAGAAARVRARIETSVRRAVNRGKLVEEDATGALAPLEVATDVDALADRDLSSRPSWRTSRPSSPSSGD